jgi:hypothetical protein
LIPKKYVDHSSEMAGYEEYNNDVNDLRYQEFVSPITKAIQDKFSTSAEGWIMTKDWASGFSCSKRF